MKIAFIVSSSIQVDNQYPLTYSHIRSYFNNEERLRHTVFTINSLERFKDTSTIYLVDTSRESEYYRKFFSYQANLKYISVHDEFSEIYNEVISHPHKSRCEGLILNKFMDTYAHELDQYDFIFKISGRYFFDSSFSVDQLEKDKLLFKAHHSFEWRDEWQLHYLDLRQSQLDNTLRQYPSVLFGWDRKFNTIMKNMFLQIANTVTEPGKSGSDMETLLYYFTRLYESSIIEYNWIVYGWTGTSGQFVRY